MEPIIRLVNVSKSFGTQKVLDGVSCEIPRGKTTVFVGPSGVGKTVLIKLMVGLHHPEAGQVLFGKQDVPTLTRSELYALRRKMGMLFQDAALFDSSDVFENVAFPLRHHTSKSNSEIAEIVNRHLRDVGLKDVGHKFPSELSGGMRKRVGLARALVLNPDVIFFDEPTSGLDPVTAAAIDELIVSTQQRLGTTFVVISHDVPSTRRIADMVGMLYQAKLVGFGPANEILNSNNAILRQFFDRQSDGPIQIV